MPARDHKITFRVNDTAKANLDLYCQIQGLELSEMARNAVAKEIAPMVFQQLSSVGHVSDTPRAHTSIKDNLLSLDNKCPVGQAKKKTKEKIDSSQQSFGKGFIAKIDSKKFPERVFKAIYENWESIQQSELSGVDMAELYNGYCKSIPEGQTPCHPNSWILGGGWNNSEAEKKEGDYDF